MKNDTHSVPVGYILWLFGFLGAHRFYYGRPLTGTIYFLTFGLLGVGWIIDFFKIPTMEREADLKYHSGKFDYNVSWLLLTFLGVFGVHRFYLKRWLTGLLWLCTGGFFIVGVLYDFWKLNDLVSRQNKLEGVRPTSLTS